MRYLARLIPLAFLFILLLSGCGVTRKVAHPVKTTEQTLGHPPTLDLNVDMQPDANDNSPVAFDVVLAKDKALLKQLTAMSAADWFKKRAQIKRDQQAKIEVYSWEWVPGHPVGKVTVPVTVEVLGVVGFANYATAGDHRAVLALSGSDDITFKESDFMVAPGK